MDKDLAAEVREWWERPEGETLRALLRQAFPAIRLRGALLAGDYEVAQRELGSQLVVEWLDDLMVMLRRASIRPVVEEIDD